MKIPQMVKKSFKDGKSFEFKDIDKMLPSVINEDRDVMLHQMNERFFLPFDDVNIDQGHIMCNIKNSEINQVGLNNSRYMTFMTPLFELMSWIQRECFHKYNHRTYSDQFKRHYPTWEDLFKRILVNLKLIGEKWNLPTDNIFKGKGKKLTVIVQGSTIISDTQEEADINNGFEYLHNFAFPKFSLCLLHPHKNTYVKMDLNISVPIIILNWLFQPIFHLFAVLHEPKRKKFLIRIRKDNNLRNSGKKKKYVDKYIYLTPTEYHNISEDNEPDFTENLEADISPRATHFRRAYYRTLRSDFYKHKQGQEIYIHPTWVGESCKTIRHKQYKVILDLEGHLDDN